jgi:hypothetical protein
LAFFGAADFTAFFFLGIFSLSSMRYQSAK